MITTEKASKMLLEDIEDAIEDVSNDIVDIIEKEYQAFPKWLGNAEISREIRKEAKTTLHMIFLAKGQRALIAEYGKGSKMETTTKGNPSINEYLNGEIFNKDRLKFNYATASRVKSNKNSDEKEYYYDLDGGIHVKRARQLYNRETGISLKNKKMTKPNKRFEPIEPKHIVRKAIEQNLNKIKDKIIEKVIANQAIRMLVDGIKFKVTL